VVALPLTGCVPVQPPEAEQVCASLALHCKVAFWPTAMLLLAAAKVIAGFALAPAVALEIVD
jgi:hypothetical protein